MINRQPEVLSKYLFKNNRSPCRLITTWFWAPLLWAVSDAEAEGVTTRSGPASRRPFCYRVRENKFPYFRSNSPGNLNPMLRFRTVLSRALRAALLARVANEDSASDGPDAAVQRVGLYVRVQGPPQARFLGAQGQRLGGRKLNNKSNHAHLAGASACAYCGCTRRRR